MTIKEYESSSPMTLSNGVVSLFDETEQNQVGGKAYHLGRIASVGLPVPAGVALTVDFACRAFLEGGVTVPSGEYNRGEGLDLVSAAALRQQVIAMQLSQEAIDILADIHTAIGSGGPLIVRSSAVGEDSIDASFAGQLDSFPDIMTIADLHGAIKECWASQWSDRAVTYQLSRGVNLNGMAVIIQKQITAAFSGVLFTESPAFSTNGSSEMMGEYCYGAGSQLVSGDVDPGRFYFDRSTGDLRSDAFAETDINGEDDGKTIRATASTLYEYGKKLEGLFKHPQDIEWVIDVEGKLHLVQSRPIVSGISPTVTDEPKVTWSNANINENYPGVVSPYLYSLATESYRYYFANLGRGFGIREQRIQAMNSHLGNLIGSHAGRLYYNLTSLHAVICMAPFGSQLVEYFNQFVGAEERPDIPEDARSFAEAGRGRLGIAWELCVIVFSTLWRYCTLTKRVERFEKTVGTYASDTQPDTFKKRTVTQLGADLRRFFDIRFHQWNNAGLADVAAMVTLGLMKVAIRKNDPGDWQVTLNNIALKGIPDLASNQPVLELWGLSRLVRDNEALLPHFLDKTDSETLWRIIVTDESFVLVHREIQAFLDNHGYRCSGELLLTTESFQERPEAFIDILKNYVNLTGESPLEALEHQKALREKEMTRMVETIRSGSLLARAPYIGAAARFSLLVSLTQKSIQLRERARLKQALLYSRLRRLLLAIGNKLTSSHDFSQADDIFYFSYQEVNDIVAGRVHYPDQLCELVALRRAEHSRLEMVEPPDTIVLPEGTTYIATDETGVVEGDEIEERRTFTGVSACNGSVRGRAMSLESVMEACVLQPGDILVVRQTDPGWGPLFFLIGGLVIERGGLLSHGAILAREYGLPTVVGVKNATRLIPSGATVVVDGNKGRVEIVDE